MGCSNLFLLLCFLSITLFHSFANFFQASKLHLFFHTLSIAASFRTYSFAFSIIPFFAKFTHLKHAICNSHSYCIEYGTFSGLQCFLSVIFFNFIAYILRAYNISPLLILKYLYFTTLISRLKLR